MVVSALREASQSDERLRRTCNSRRFSEPAVFLGIVTGRHSMRSKNRQLQAERRERLLKIRAEKSDLSFANDYLSKENVIRALIKDGLC